MPPCMDARNTDPQMPFRAAWWLKNPHLQTLWPVLFRRRPAIAVERERVTLADGDFIDLAWPVSKQSGPQVLILHGLEGSLHSHYARSTMQSLHNQGFNPIFMHFRGCSGEPNRLPRSYHSGDTADVDFIAKHIRRKTGRDIEAAIGFSLGGNVLLKWLGEQVGDSCLKAAVAVSVPFQLNDCALRLEKGLSRIYQGYLIGHLKRSYRRKFRSMPSPLAIDLEQVKTFRDFDHNITAPLHGFDGVDHYYSASSSKQFLKRIQVPTLLIQAMDDPFMLPETIPTPDELSGHIRLELTRQGGHVGFVTGSSPWQTAYWLDRRLPTYLHEQFGSQPITPLIQGR